MRGERRPLLTVVLVGAPGSGKSTVAPLVAELLGTTFVDTDEVVAERMGRSVGDIFVVDGEAEFRRAEEAVALDVLDRPGVVALGSGAVGSVPVRGSLIGRHVVWLDVDVANAARRSGLDVARPAQLGNVRGMFLRMLRERAELYASVSQARVDTSGLTPAEVAGAVVSIVQSSA